MLEIFLLLIACFVISLLFLSFVVIGVDIIRALCAQPKHKSNYKSHTQNQAVKNLKEDSISDSEGDGLMLFDEPMFPPEEDY